MSRIRRSVFSRTIEKPQAKKALVSSAEKYIAVCVQKMCEQHKIDSETALTALMAQCAKQMIKPSHAVHKTDLLSKLSNTHLGQRIAQGDLEKLPEPDEAAERDAILNREERSKPAASVKKEEQVKMPFFKRL